jgi:hypothetical protein
MINSPEFGFAKEVKLPFESEAIWSFAVAKKICRWPQIALDSQCRV